MWTIHAIRYTSMVILSLFQYLRFQVCFLSNYLLYFTLFWSIWTMFSSFIVLNIYEKSHRMIVGIIAPWSIIISLSYYNSILLLIWTALLSSLKESVIDMALNTRLQEPVLSLVWDRPVIFYCLEYCQGRGR